jgi:hypothetical protein
MEASTRSADRWAGTVLCLGSLLYASAVLVFMLAYGQPESSVAGSDPTIADRVAHYQSHWQLAHAMWSLELIAVFSLAVSGFVLMGRIAPSQGLVPRRLSWATVAAGATFLVVMYPVMLGGYPAAVATRELGLFAVVNGVAQLIFLTGNSVIFVGFAAAFASEGPPHGALSRQVAVAGQIAFLIALIAGLAMLAGIGLLQMAAPVGLLAFLLASYLGWAIARHA